VVARGSTEKAGAGSERDSLAVLPLMLLGSQQMNQRVPGIAEATGARAGNLAGPETFCPISAVLNVPAEATPSRPPRRLAYVCCPRAVTFKGPMASFDAKV